MLEPVGVADFEETVLGALLAADRRTPGELAEALGASADAVYAALKRLEDLGLAARDGETFAAVEPVHERGAAGTENAVVVRQPGLCDALTALFETVWAQAAPLFAGGGGNPELDAENHAILQLLNAGLTDDVIGRQLGISERTVRRRVAELAVRLGAGSRFQIGAQAVRRGWV